MTCTSQGASGRQAVHVLEIWYHVRGFDPSHLSGFMGFEQAILLEQTQLSQEVSAVQCLKHLNTLNQMVFLRLISVVGRLYF